MTWGKMDDKFHRNRKVRELRRIKGGREALGDWAHWWSWCLDDPELTGVVPEFELDASERKSAALLVQVGLWDVVDGGYRFHDFHEYNPRREQLEAKRAADRERIAGKRAASRTDVARDNSASRTQHASESQERPTRVAATRDPDPTQPDPTHPNGGARVDHEHVVELFGRMRAEAHQAKHGRPGGRYVRGPRDWQHVEDLAAFANLQAGPAAALEDSLRGFLSDPWAIEAGWPVSAWAKDPGRYMGRSGGAPKRQSAIAVAEAAVVVAKEAYERSYGTEQRDEHRRAFEAAKSRLARLRLAGEAAS